MAYKLCTDNCGPIALVHYKFLKKNIKIIKVAESY
jgi:hypothetical protein